MWLGRRLSVWFTIRRARRRRLKLNWLRASISVALSQSRRPATLSFARRATSPLFSNRHGSRRLDANFAVFSYVHTYIRGYLSAVDDFLVAQLAKFLAFVLFAARHLV